MKQRDTDTVIHRLEDGEYVQLLISRRPLRRVLPHRVKEELQRWTLRDVRSGQLFAPQATPHCALDDERAGREPRG